MSYKSNSLQNHIKQFSKSYPDVLWKNMDANTITLKDKNKDLYLENNIIIKGTIQNPSDFFIKNNIQPLCSEETKSITLLDPVQYIYKNDLSKKQHYGLIAQEVEKIYPNLVSNDNVSKYKSINYIELIPILIGKIKLLEEEILQLKLK